LYFLAIHQGQLKGPSFVYEDCTVLPVTYWHRIDILASWACIKFHMNSLKCLISIVAVTLEVANRKQQQQQQITVYIGVLLGGRGKT
jgi:hypothetical protein